MRIWRTIFLIIGMILLCISSVSAQKGKEIHKTFPAKERVQINTTSGDCIIKISTDNQITVDIRYSERSEGSFEPEFIESGDRLKLKEHWSGWSSGNVTWTVAMPAKTDLEFSTASGDISVADLKNKIKGNTASGNITIEDTDAQLNLSTASGDISLRNVKGECDLSTASGDIDAGGLNGEIEMSTASGDIKISDGTGSFELSCASGDIEARKLETSGACSFSTASGDIDVMLAKSPVDDLEFSTASGDITLDYHGNELKGIFELTSRKDRGTIHAPVSFDKVEEFERYGNVYERKSFHRGEKPRITLETSSGDIDLKP